METLLTAIIVLGAFVAGILVERHNTAKINAALVEAQTLFKALEIKVGIVKVAAPAIMVAPPVAIPAPSVAPTV
jgi:hypothetical protein